LLAGLKYFVPRLKTIWADAAYRGQELAAWCKVQGDWDLDVVERAAGVRGFAVVPKRWIVERTFGWLSRYRRMSKDYAQSPNQRDAHRGGDDPAGACPSGTAG
jgi:putative transposase